MVDAEVNKRGLSRKSVTTVSFALNLIDSFSQKHPTGWVKVFIKGCKPKIIKNPSGYYVFLDMPGNTYTVGIKSQFYFEKEVLVELSALTPGNPVKNVTLKPLPSYPFPGGTTLIRGVVNDPDENPASNAEVEVVGKSMSTITTEKGEFVFYFKGLTKNDIIKDGIKRFVKGNPGKIMTLEAVKGPESGGGQLDEVEECTTASLKDPIQLS